MEPNTWWVWVDVFLVQKSNFQVLQPFFFFLGGVLFFGTNLYCKKNWCWKKLEQDLGNIDPGPKAFGTKRETIFFHFGAFCRPLFSGAKFISEGSCDSFQGTVPLAEIEVESCPLFAKEFVWHDGSWNGQKMVRVYLPMGIPTFRSFILKG